MSPNKNGGSAFDESISSDLYYSIGEFAVRFQEVYFAVHTTVVFMLHKEGIKNQQVCNILLADLTPGPLNKLLMGLIFETKQLNDSEVKKVNNMLNRYQNLITFRNDLFHGIFFIGYGSGSPKKTAKETVATGFKHRYSKKGAGIKNLNISIDEFESWINEAKALKSLFFRLHGCFVSDYSVDTNFITNENGNVSVPPKKA